MLRKLYLRAAPTRLLHLSSSRARFASSLKPIIKARSNHGNSNYRFISQNAILTGIIPQFLEDESKESNEINSKQFHSDSSRVVKKTSNQEKYFSNSGWMTRHIGHRLAWGLAACSASFIIMVGVLRALQKILTLDIRNGITTFAGSILAGMGLALVSGLSTLFPSIGRYIVRNFILPLNQSPIRPSGLPCLNVPYNKGIIQSGDFLTMDKNSDQYMIRFCGNAYRFQETLEEIEKTISECDVNIRAFNYPKATCSDDLVNAGIAQIYHLTESKNWSNQDIENNVFLYGHSLGGAIVLQVAQFFKEKNNINIPVFVDRSFESLDSIAVNIADKVGVPKWLGKMVVPFVLYAGGGWNLDSIAAAKKLNPDRLHYINLGHTRRLKEDADPVIPNGTTFTEGFNKINRGGNTKNILEHLNIEGSSHVVFPPFEGNFHGAPLDVLKTFSGVPANELLKEAVIQQRKTRPSLSA